MLSYTNCIAMKKFKIAIDIASLQAESSNRGIGFYTKRLIASLQKVVKTNPTYKDFQIDIFDGKDQKIINNCNLVHYPHFDIFQKTLTITNKPTIVTVHDLIPLSFPNHYPVGIRGRISWMLQKKELSKASYIITDSISSRFEITKHLKFPQDRIFSIYLAADGVFHPLKKNKAKLLTKNLDLPDKFVLYVGDVNWNKNIENLAEVCLSLNYPLIIVGTAAATATPPIHPWTKSLQNFKLLQAKNVNLIRTLGYLPNDILNSLYNLATFYCQPSYAEGFGLPLVEAMQAGCPIVYSETSSLPEITNYLGLFFDPNSLQEMKKRFKQMWNDDSLQKTTKQTGLQRAKVFTWESTAIQTLEVYRLALLENA